MRPPAIVTRAVRAGLFSVQSPDPGVAALQEVSQDLYIIGLIAAAACALSVIMGVIYFLFTLCGGAGSHICCAPVPVGYLCPLLALPMQACCHSWCTG